MTPSKGPWVITGIMLAALASDPRAHAWDSHAHASWQAFSVLPEVTQAAPVEAEELDAFLRDTAPELAGLLDQEEAWARAHVPSYPPRPDGLRFAEGGADLRARFLRALRVNPTLPLPLFLQKVPGVPTGARGEVAESAITLFPETGATRFLELRAGERASAQDVLCAASDEPDFGLDIGLWSDSATSWAGEYAFGEQPFGNPNSRISSQGPFHMGFFHEAGIIYKAAPFLGRALPEYRLHLFQSLARFAFESGHPYWGWRFTGWAVHYVQDLTNPYHSAPLPGVSTLRMLWINALDLIGVHAPKSRWIQLVTNRHFALENYGAEIVETALAAGDRAHPALAALADSSRDEPAGESFLRAQVSAAAKAIGKRTDRALVKSLPERLVDDPDYLFGDTEPGVSVVAELARRSPEDCDRMAALFSVHMAEFGSRSRALVLGTVPVLR